MVKKILIGLGLVFLVLLILELILEFKNPYYMHYLIGEKTMVERAKKEAYRELQEFSKEKGVHIQDFKLTEIRRVCCIDGYFYNVLYCHPRYYFKYNSYLSSMTEASSLKQGELCEITDASQSSPYLGY